MIRDDVLDLCASIAGAAEDYPFGEGMAVCSRSEAGCSPLSRSRAPRAA
jgi:hypothetical protein